MSIELKIVNRYNMPWGAEFSSDRTHRYALWRIWDQTKPLIMFIGLNPSTANENSDDPTVKSCGRIARANGYGGFYIVNCWSYVSTNPNRLKLADATLASFNDNILKVVAEECKTVVFAWGNFEIVRKLWRDKELYKMFPNAKALAINKNGSPKHPLY